MAYITFSTLSYPEAERLEASMDVYAAMANIDVSLPRGKVPEIETRIRLLPGISIALIKSSPLIVKRRSRQIQDGNDDFALMLNPIGHVAWRSELAGVGEVECHPGKGALVLMTALEPSNFITTALICLISAFRVYCWVHW